MSDALSWSHVVAGRIGVLPPDMFHYDWLLLHRSEAEACMGSMEYRLLSQQMGWNRDG